MRKLLIICAAVLQMLMLAFMGGQREYILRTGRIIYLRTVPFDPRDAFRGDYARLSYEISSIDKKYFKDGLVTQAQSGEKYSYRNKYRGKPVYTVLKIDDNGLANIDYATDKKPPKGQLYIRGRQDYSYENSFINVLYGIEAFFVEQGKGRQLENRMLDKERSSFEIEVALGDNGIAVIKGYRRSPLTIRVENIERKDGVVQSCHLVLTNTSDKPVAVVDLPGYSSLKLDFDLGFFNRTRNLKLTKDSNSVKVEDKDVHIIQPNQDYKFIIDFNDPHWSAIETKKGPKHLPFDKLKESGGIISFFSLAYESPSSEQCKDLKDADLIWHGRLSSRNLHRYESQLPPMMRRPSSASDE
jgi:uncharacterized membrane-anchored protein